MKKTQKHKPKSVTELKIEDAIANADKYIAQMEQMDDKKLSKHIDLFQQQIEMARKQNNEAACRLIYIYEHLTVIARVNKNFPAKK